MLQMNATYIVSLMSYPLKNNHKATLTMLNLRRSLLKTLISFEQME